MDALAMIHTWLYKGTWTDDVIIMFVTMGNGRNLSFYFDGHIKEFEGPLRLEQLPNSWELVE